MNAECALIKDKRTRGGNLHSSFRLVSSFLISLLLLFCLLPTAHAELPGGDDLWLSAPPRLPAVDLYFFWSSRCPHCQQARPFIESLPAEHPWIRLHSLEIYDHRENRGEFERMAKTVSIVPQSVPTFMWCGQHYTGYSNDQVTGGMLLSGLTDCYREHYGATPEGSSQNPQTAPRMERTPKPEVIELPWLGSLDSAAYSLPMLTVVLGGLDAFNPCAFFILLFLLSLLVNTRSRGRMLLVGGVFVAVSGLVYFAFMAAWLNLFQVLGGVQLITLVAGIIAVFIGMINIKDYFWLKEGVSLSLADSSKERLFGRMRGLLTTDRLPTLLVGTLVLAVAANSYELLCTMGLPMVFTRILTLEQLSNLQYYVYLALYNLVYVLPLAVIVGLFVVTMGRRKLSESEGRFLKLLSGTMMGGLGLVLVLSPEWLSQPLVAILLIVSAVILSLMVQLVYRPRIKQTAR
ncbi:MAG: hypothetical protein PVG22_11920 [Chromatiales bacterium]